MWKIGGAEQSDRRLAKLAADGNAEAGEQIVQRYYESVYRYMLALCRNTTIAEDLTQATFAACWKSLSSYEGKALLRTWIHRIAHRQYLRWLDGRETTTELDDQKALPGFESTVVESVWIQAAIERLEPELRETLVLFYLHEMPCKEIAEVLMIPRGTVLSRLHTARQRLRAFLTASSLQDGDIADLPTNSSPGATNYEMSKASS